MSGMVNPNPIVRQPTTQGPNLPGTMSNRLGGLDATDLDQVTISDKGEIKSGGFFMMLRSGLHAFFGVGKSEDDIKSNRETLQNLMGNLRSEAKQMMIDQNKEWKEGDYEKHWNIDPDKFADGVIRQVLKGQTALNFDGKLFGDRDPKITVQDRIDRGSYVSGLLAGQIKDRFDATVSAIVDKSTGRMIDLDEKVAKQRAEARRHQRNEEIFGGVNEDAVNRFLGREVKNSGILPSLVNAGATLADAITGTAQKLVGIDAKTPFRQVLAEIREQGTEQYPKEDTAYWDAFEKYWGQRIDAPPDSSLRTQFDTIEKKLQQFAKQQARDGNPLGEAEISAKLKELLTDKFQASRVQEFRNHEFVVNAKPQDLANAVREWRSQQPLEVQQRINQNDCDWLANQLELSHDSERLLRERAPDMLTGFKDFLDEFTSPDEQVDKYSSHQIMGRMYETVGKNYQNMEVPAFMSNSERFKHCQAKNPDNTTKGVKEFFHPETWGPKQLASLLGDSMNAVLIDRHNRMEQMMPEMQKNRESREILQENLSLFPSLKTQANKFFEHPEMQKHNPTKPSDFVFHIVTDPIVNARTQLQMEQETKQGIWKSKLPPEPQPPQSGASQDEIAKYQQAKTNYERLAGEEHGAFMKIAGQIRDSYYQLQEANRTQFQVLDDVESTVKTLSGLGRDLSTLSDEEKAEVGHKIDELRTRGGQMFDYAFETVNDHSRNMRITDKEATAILGAVMTAWCDIDAVLNDIEAKMGRTGHDMTVVLRDTPKPQGSNQALLDAHSNVLQSLQDAQKALEKGDRKALGGASDEFKRQLVAAFEAALPIFRSRGPDEPQARELLDLLAKATRTAVELDRTPDLRDRKELGIRGWDEMVKDLLPPDLDLPQGKNEPPGYFRLRDEPIPPSRTPPTNVEKPKSTNPFDDDFEQISGTQTETRPQPPRVDYGVIGQRLQGSIGELNTDRNSLHNASGDDANTLQLATQLKLSVIKAAKDASEARDALIGRTGPQADEAYARLEGLDLALERSMDQLRDLDEARQSQNLPLTDAVPGWTELVQRMKPKSTNPFD